MVMREKERGNSRACFQKTEKKVLRNLKRDGFPGFFRFFWREHKFFINL